jgi:cytochrome c-type biogenesis protein
LAGQFFFLNEWVFLAEDWIGAVSGTGGDLLATGLLTSALLSFSAGLISFLSPCVLPLVPAYIGFLSGAAISSRPMER